MKAKRIMAAPYTRPITEKITGIGLRVASPAPSTTRAIAKATIPIALNQRPRKAWRSPMNRMAIAAGDAVIVEDEGLTPLCCPPGRRRRQRPALDNVTQHAGRSDYRGCWSVPIVGV